MTVPAVPPVENYGADIPADPPGQGPGPDGDGGCEDAGLAPRARRAMSVRMVEHVVSDFDLFTADDGRRYALAKSGGSIAERISDSFVIRACLNLGLTGSFAAAAKAARSVLDSLAGAGERRTLALRVARNGGGLVLDLAEPSGSRCIVITPDGWNVQETPPRGVVFRRSRVTRPLPAPIRGGSLDELRRILSLEEEDERWHLIRGWLPAALLPDIPRPMLVFVGPQGSAKTTRAGMIVGVLDPKPPDGMGSAFGKNLSDDEVRASAHYLVAYDNLGHVSESVSDHLARLVTGTTVERRELYSDDDLAVITYKRTGVLTAITLPPFQADTRERLILINLDRLSDAARKTEAQLWERWNEAHPRILGALLDVVVVMLKNMPKVQADTTLALPRMADYFQALHAQRLSDAETYRRASREAMAEAADDDPFVTTILRWIDSCGGAWEGTPEQGWRLASKHRIQGGAPYEPAPWWPRSPAAFGRALTKASEPLRAVGVELGERRSDGKRLRSISRIPTSERLTLSELLRANGHC